MEGKGAAMRHALIVTTLLVVLVVVVVITRQHPELVLVWRSLAVLLGWVFLLGPLRDTHRSRSDKIAVMITAVIFSVLFLLGLDGSYEKGPWDRP
jgi:hypothetical protein